MMVKWRVVILFLLMHLMKVPAGEREILLKLTSPPNVLTKSSDGQLMTTGESSIDNVLFKCGEVKIQSLIAPSMFKTASQSPEFRELTRWLKITLPANADLDSILQSLQELPEVVYAQPNRTFHLHHLPNDPLASRQYSLKNIHAYQAWDIEKGKREVIVAVIDTGIDYEHPDLQPNIWINSGEDLNGNGRVDPSDFNGADDDGNGFIDDIQGWDFTDAPNYPDGGDYRDRDADPMDEMGHGTAVAGIIAAVMDNEIGIAGVAPGCRVMNLRSFTGSGLGEEDDAASAILYAIANGARVINMSWGDVFISRVLDDVIKYAASKNVVLVASSGNAATDRIHYPSAFDHVISVGATNENDAIASFSNFGPTLDLVAPGSGILSTIREAKYDSSLNGTSFAAPFVSAAAALVISRDQSLPAETVRGILLSSADDLGSPGWDYYYGAGRLNIERALGRVAGAIVSITSPWLDQGFPGGEVKIYGSAWSPAMEKYTLSYGLGHNPEQWQEIVTVQRTRVIDGLLGTWRADVASDTSYTLRLQVFDRSGSVIQSAVRIFIDQTPPFIRNVQLTTMIEEDTHCILLGFDTDDLCEGIVNWRQKTGSSTWQRLEMGYRGRRHQMLLSPQMAADQIEIKIGARNTAGLEATDDNSGRCYSADLSTPPIDRVQYSPLEYYLPHGHILNRRADFNGDGLTDIVIGYFDDQKKLTTAVYGFDGIDYRKLAAIERATIPRGVGDTDGDGRLELLCGYGFSSYLYEVSSTQPLTLVESYAWSNESIQYWAADLTDIDSDGRDEVIMRTVNGSSDLFQVLKRESETSFRVLGQISNPTSGENINGVPRCLTGDFDGDGRMEILLGDSDGDIYMSEFNGSGFTTIWQDRLPLIDTIDYLSSGDYDGDGLTEFVVGCHSDPSVNTEHYFDDRHWLFRVYKRVANNTYTTVAEWRFFGYESPKDFLSGVSSGDDDGDGKDEIAICVYPDFYLIHYDDFKGYQLSFHARPIETNAAVIVDSNGDGRPELWLSNGSYCQPYLRIGMMTGPAVPVGVTAQPLDESQVRLRWYPVPGAQRYTVYRGTDKDNLEPRLTTPLASYIDGTVIADQLYWYAVTAHDSTKIPNVSSRSALVSARPGAKPFLVSATMASMQSVRLYFSEAMNESAQDPAHYQLSGGLGKPTSCTLDASGKEVLLHLRQPFPAAGEYRVEVSDLMDLDGTPLDTNRNAARFTVAFRQNPPYIVDGRLLDARSILITFNEPMQPTSLSHTSHYDLGEKIRILSAEPQHLTNDAVRLQIDAHTPLGAIGKIYTLRVRGVRNAAGIAIVPGYGDVLQLLFAAENLDHVFTYPNPYRVGLDEGGITFANLTPNAEIQIMTLQGYPLRTLFETDGDGGVTWDVCDDRGRALASGIYLYRVVSGKMVKLGKLAIVR